MEKTCCTCKQRQPLSAFSKNRCTKDGLTPTCKRCVSLYKARYYSANAEKIKAKSAKWSEENPERKRSTARQYYLLHAGEMVAKTRAWRNANPEKAKALFAKWRQENPEKRKQIYRRYREKAGDTLNDRDSYIASKLGLKVSQVPKELMELKRLHLQIHRKLKDLKK